MDVPVQSEMDNLAVPNKNKIARTHTMSSGKDKYNDESSSQQQSS